MHRKLAMNLHSRHDWQPLSRAGFEDVLKQEVMQLPPEALKIYEAHASGIVEQPCYRSEQYGIERVFVVARHGVRVLLFDDVEDGFAVGVPDSDGVLRNWGQDGPLLVAVRGLAELPPVVKGF
jgi:hypothetical protein